MMKLKKAVFPVAGLGTRFLPATKTIPKEMLPIVDRPIIQYAVDEAVEAGCDTLIFVTGRSKRAVERTILIAALSLRLSLRPRVKLRHWKRFAISSLLT